MLFRSIVPVEGKLVLTRGAVFSYYEFIHPAADRLTDEDFLYSDGSRQKRIWRLKRLADGRFSGRADDVIGEAQGEQSGNALRWHYTLALPVDGRVIEVQFDDWMYLIDARVMLNKAQMSKFGIHLGEVTLSFTKR